MLSDGIVDLLATDAHDTKARPPVLSRARDHVAARYGEELAAGLVRCDNDTFSGAAVDIQQSRPQIVEHQFDSV